MASLYDTEGFDATMDVSASTRKFQQSIIVKQDPNKSGILAFLSVAEEQITQPPTRDPQPTMRPQTSGGGY
jgi:hypothetical protein